MNTVYTLILIEALGNVQSLIGTGPIGEAMMMNKTVALHSVVNKFHNFV